jgi:hypothetical protein
MRAPRTTHSVVSRFFIPLPRSLVRSGVFQTGSLCQKNLSWRGLENRSAKHGRYPIFHYVMIFIINRHNPSLFHIFLPSPGMISSPPARFSRGSRGTFPRHGRFSGLSYGFMQRAEIGACEVPRPGPSHVRLCGGRNSNGCGGASTAISSSRAPFRSYFHAFSFMAFISFSGVIG